MVAEDVAGVERVGADGGAAVATGGTEVVQAFEVAALALPVADGIVHELEIADASEIRDGEDGIKDGLQPHILPLRNRSYDFFCTSMRLGIGMEVLILEKSTLSGAAPLC